MEISIKTGAISEIKADAAIAGVFEKADSLEVQTASLDTALGGMITRLTKNGEITGKLNQLTILYVPGEKPVSKVAVLGLGKREEITADRVRGAFAEACRTLEQKKVTSAVVLPVNIPSIPTKVLAQVITEGAILGTYTFRNHFTKEAEHGKLEHLVLVSTGSGNTTQLKAGKTIGEVIAGAVVRARDMVNEPANFMTPARMAEIAGEVASENGLGLEILDREQMKRLGMGGLLGVSAGSEQPPKFIILNYNGRKSKGIDIALIGKAITFDSGGISIKPSAGMEEMKGDMSGGAAVISAMGAVAQLKPSINVVGIVPATENLPSGKALKPGDVITAMGGKTIEIISTDAEGRLILADAIGYARKLKAKRIVDTATLTGAMAATLGDVCFGAFPNNQELADIVIAAGAEAGERIWPMPMYDDYKELNKSEVADIKNTGGKYAGSITAAHFLGEFVGDVPWVHLDIAGVFLSDKTRNYTVKGATGLPVRTLVNLVVSLAKK